MKHIYIPAIMIMLCASLTSKAQQSFTISPDDTLAGTAAYDQLSIYDIYMENTTNKKVSLSWSVVSIDLPAGWDYALCDLGTCYVGIPSSGTMDSVDVGGMGFLGLNINPFNIPGSGKVRISVYETGTSPGDTVTWIISSAPAAINENSERRLEVYPNPATDLVSITGIESSDLTLQVFDMLGKEVPHAPSSQPGKIDVSALPPGAYFIRITVNEQTSVLRFIKK